MAPKRKLTSKVAAVSSADKSTKSKASNKRKADSGESQSPTKKVQKTMATSGLSGFRQHLTRSCWNAALGGEFEKPYFKTLEKNVEDEISSGKDVYPPKELIFNAMNRTALKDVKVLLLGQDPYHGEGQAMGLSFSVPSGVKIPPSLRNMYTELASDIPGFKDPGHGCLEKWADQGVLLLNATLTVRKAEPNSHSDYGWQTFTDQVIKAVSEESPGTVFMLWGNFAHKKEKLVDTGKHTVLKTAHPSPLSCKKFYGCKCFSQANAALKKMGRGKIDWKL